VAVAAKNASNGSSPGAFSVMAPLRHKFKVPKLEESSQPINIEPSQADINQLSHFFSYYNCKMHVQIITLVDDIKITNYQFLRDSLIGYRSPLIK
jgi:hypothetical protein